MSFIIFIPEIFKLIGLRNDRYTNDLRDNK